MEGADWLDWLVLTLIAIVVLMVIFFSALLTLFPPTMAVGVQKLILIAIIIVLIITIIALLANGANPFKPLGELVDMALDGLLPPIIGGINGILGGLLQAPLLLIGGVTAAAILLPKVFSKSNNNNNSFGEGAKQNKMNGISEKGSQHA